MGGGGNGVGTSLRTRVVCGSLIVMHSDGLERYFVTEAGASLAVALIRPVSSGHIRGPQEVKVRQESALGRPRETLLQSHFHL